MVGPLPGLGPKADGFLHEASLGVMPSEQFGLGLHQLAGLCWQRLGDQRVQFPPRTAQQTAVSRVPHQRVLEAVDRVWRHATLVHQLGRDKSRKSGLQFILGKSPYRSQQPVRKFASDRRADLRHQPYRRQAVEPRQQRGVQRRRDRQRRQRPVKHVAVAFLAQEAALQDALGQFLDK